MEVEIKEVCQEQQTEEVVGMPSFRRLSRVLSFNRSPQSLLLSQYSPSLVALTAVSVLT